MILRTTTEHELAGRVNPIAHGVLKFQLNTTTLSHVINGNQTIKLTDVSSGAKVVVEDAWLEVHEPFASGTEFALGDSVADNSFLKYINVSSKGTFGDAASDKGVLLVNERTALASDYISLSVTAATPIPQQSTTASVTLYIAFKEVEPVVTIESDIPQDSDITGAGLQTVPASDFTYTGPNEDTPEDVGGVESGSNFSEEGTTPGGPIPINDLITMLLYPYQDPAFSSFTISGVSTLVEVGSSLPASLTFNWTTTNDVNIEENSLVIKDAGTEVLSGEANDGSAVYATSSAITKTSPNSHTFRIEGTNTREVVFARNLTVTWGLRVYFGISSNASLTTPVGITGLGQSGIKSNFPGDYQFAAGTGQYKYIAIPSVWVTASGIAMQDTGGLGSDVAYVFVDNVDIDSNGVTTEYKVYRSTNQLGGAMTISVTAG